MHDLQNKIVEVQTPNSRPQTIGSFAKNPCNETATPSHKTFSLLHHHTYTTIATVSRNHMYTIIFDPFPILPLSAPLIQSNPNPCNSQTNSKEPRHQQQLEKRQTASFRRPRRLNSRWSTHVTYMQVRILLHPHIYPILHIQFVPFPILPPFAPLVTDSKEPQHQKQLEKRLTAPFRMPGRLNSDGAHVLLTCRQEIIVLAAGEQRQQLWPCRWQTGPMTIHRNEDCESESASESKLRRR